MASGTAKIDLQVVANNEFLTIQPPSGEEWIIHNIFYGNDVELYRVNGAVEQNIFSDTRAGVYRGLTFHITNTHYLKIKNISGSNQNIGYDGVQTI